MEIPMTRLTLFSLVALAPTAGFWNDLVKLILKLLNG